MADDERLARLEAMVAQIRETQAEIKGMLAMLMPAISQRFDAMDKRIDALTEEVRSQGQTLAEIKGRIADMPTARDFGRLEGRVGEMSERLPTTIAYTPPRSAAE